ncbi:MAG: septum formation initiator family protein [Chloroflexota bacterium]|nr:septum formation initiator family protein [Chloroflexota bacterium]MDE3101528.1 septum formation initiator family protein [Chloroflexota bacterium]
MRPRRRRRSRLGDLARPAVAVVVLAAGLLLSGAFVGIAVQQSSVDRQARVAQQQIDAELAKRSELESAIAQRKTDAYVIDKARDLGYVRPGEGLIAVERGPSGLPTVRINSSDGGRFARWWALFFGAK